MTELATTAFLSERLTGIGGSDVHQVLNLEPWGCRRRLWYEKRQVPPDYPHSVDTEAMFERGHALEPLVAEKYAREAGRRVFCNERVIRHPEHPELMVHVDRLIEGLGDGRGTGVLEIKTVARESYAKLKREGLPQAYIVQLQHAMMVTGHPWGAFAVLWPDRWKLLHWDVDRDDALCDAIKAECLDFWKQVQSGEEPERLPASDKRCRTCRYRTTCQGKALLEMHGLDDPDVPYDALLADLVREYVEAREIRDEAEGLLEGVKASLEAAIGSRQVLDTDGARIYFSPQSSLRWYTSALEKDHPELAAKYKKPSVSRPLRVFAK